MSESGDSGGWLSWLSDWDPKGPSGSGMDDPRTEEGANSDDGGGIGESQVRKWVAGILVSGILTAVGTVAGLSIDIVDTVRSSLTSAGAGLASEAGSIGDMVIELLIEMPLEATGDLAASTGLAAPIVSVLVFALVAAMVSVIVYGLYRAVVIVT